MTRTTIATGLVAAAALVSTTLIAISTASGPVGADTGGYSPVDRPGLPLSVPATELAASLQCHGDLAAGSLEPVLLNPATGVTPDQNYSWNYERAFTAQGRPWCAVWMPFHTEGDIQTAGEYLVFAIRSMYAAAHRRIAILGHSQGAMSMRWALRFWPDTRAMVDDVIGFAGTNHGTAVKSACFAGVTRCPPASWQQAQGARFIDALNSGAETFAGISYTEVYTRTDEVVRPNTSSMLTTGAGAITNVATQSICPLDLDEHLTIGTVDPVAYALAMDALNHPGPADPTRIPKSVCLQLYQPGVDPLNAQNYIQMLKAVPGLLDVDLPGLGLEGVPEVLHEPPLQCYVLASGCR